MTSKPLKTMDNHGVFRTDKFIFMPTEQMTQVANALFSKESETHIHVFGPRRHGKTTLMGHLKREALSAGYQPTYIDGRVRFTDMKNEKEILRGIYGEAIDPFGTENFSYEEYKELDSAFRKELKQSDNIDALINTLFLRLEEFSVRIGKPIFMAFDEMDTMQDSPYYGTFIAFCEKHKEMGNLSPIRLVTSALNPLPWISRLQQDFSNAVTHTRIGKLGLEFTSTLTEAIPLEDQEEREKVAVKIIEETGGYGGLMYSAIGAVSYGDGGNNIDGMLESITKAFSSIERNASEAHQLGSEEDYLATLLPEHAKSCLDVYADLISGKPNKIVKTGLITATHLTLTGLVDIADDNITVGPVAPLIRRTFDLEWVKWQREIEGIGVFKEVKPLHNVAWNEPSFRYL